LIDTGELTSYLVQQLTVHFQEEDVIVGDGVAPEGGGWSEGTPNTVGGFVSYVVLSSTSPVSATLPNTPLCTTVPVRLDVPYVLTAYENTRYGADHTAARSRIHVKNMPVVVANLGDLVFKGHEVWIDSITGAVRNDSTHPKMWSASTNFHVGVARVSG